MVTVSDKSVDDQIALFTERATPLGTHVERVPDSASLINVIKGAAEAAGSDKISVSRQVADAAPEFLSGLESAGIGFSVVQSSDGARDQPVGVSLAFRGIAETGSVMLDERHIQDRAPSLMTIHNIVLIRVADLIPSLDSTPELLREIATSGPGGYATFVTGPSRTADIEMSLTVGVQGPAQISMIFVDTLT